MAWMDGVELEPRYSSKNLISCMVYSDPPGAPWSFSAIYGPPAAASRRAFWSQVPGLLATTLNSKLLIGDFNGILQDTESWSRQAPIGGSASSSTAMRDCFALMGLHDLGCFGPPFTWTRRRGGLVHSQARLDRAVASVDWCGMFPRSLVRNIADSVSDHCSIVLDTNGDNGGGIKPFHFEAIWTRDIRSHWVVKAAWMVAPHYPHAKRLHRRIGESRRAL